MASTGSMRRRVNLFSVASTTQNGAGPYEEVFASLVRKAPFETQGAFNRTVRVSHVREVDNRWFLELYLIVDHLEVLEVSAEPDVTDKPTFVIPPNRRSFATRTCGIFDLRSKICAIEYVRTGPKVVDFEEVLSKECVGATRQREAQFSLSPIIEENFIREIDAFERIRQVRVVFQRPNPGWGDISILSAELEGSGDARREVVLTAPRDGGILKNRGLLDFVRKQLISGMHSISNVIVHGKKAGDAGETQVSSEKSTAKRVAALPVTDNEQLYRRQFITAVFPLLGDSDENNQ